MLANAFNLLLSIHGRTVTLTRLGTPAVTVTVRIAPSNYFRKLEGPSDTIIEGREFVLSKRALDNVSFPAPKRNDRIQDPEFGNLTILESEEMYDLGGSTMGYRVRTG